MGKSNTIFVIVMHLLSFRLLANSWGTRLASLNVALVQVALVQALYG